MSAEILIRISKNMRRYRKEKNLTQRQLAKKAQIHHTYISKIENAKSNIFLSTLFKITYALRVKPKDLVK